MNLTDNQSSTRNPPPQKQQYSKWHALTIIPDGAGEELRRRAAVPDQQRRVALEIIQRPEIPGQWLRELHAHHKDKGAAKHTSIRLKSHSQDLLKNTTETDIP